MMPYKTFQRSRIVSESFRNAGIEDFRVRNILKILDQGIIIETTEETIVIIAFRNPWVNITLTTGN